VDSAGWLTPFEETVKLDVVVGWDADSGVKEGTTPETNSLVEAARDLLNIELNFLWMVPNDQFSEKFALQISSGDIPDIVMLSSGDFYEFMDSEYLRDLTDAYNEYASDELRTTVEGFGEAAVKYSSRDGKLYGIPAQLDTAESVAGLYYRSDWLDAIGIGVPTNTQEMNDMLVALAEYGVTVNGGKDTVGLGTTSNVLNTNFALSAYFQCYGAYPNKWIMRDGVLVNGMVQDEMLDALNGLKDLYERGGLATDFATWNSDQFNERVTTDQVGAAFGTYYIPAWPLNQNKDANPEAEWAELSIASIGSRPAMNQVSINHFNVVTKDAPENAEAALIKLLNMTLAANSNSTFDKTVFGGRDLAGNGASIFYLPVYMYFPTPWNQYRENIWAAYESQDPSGLITDIEQEWYGYMNDYLTKGNACENLGTAWGMYKSRLSEDMGIAIGLAARESGEYEPAYYYGPATRTEQRVSSTLSDMAVSFFVEYIMGQKGEADWESFKQSWNEMGGQAWTDEVNEQYKSITQ
jgi:putative aldouronate transport system substrate-binding protein